jgi:hypothetical protein
MSPEGQKAVARSAVSKYIRGAIIASRPIRQVLTPKKPTTVIEKKPGQ